MEGQESKKKNRSPKRCVRLLPKVVQAPLRQSGIGLNLTFLTQKSGWNERENFIPRGAAGGWPHACVFWLCYTSKGRAFFSTPAFLSTESDLRLSFFVSFSLSFSARFFSFSSFFLAFSFSFSLSFLLPPLL